MTLKILLLLLCLNFVRSQETHDHGVKGNQFFFTKHVIETLLDPDHDWVNNILVSPFALEFGVGVVAFGSTGQTLEEITNVTGTHLLETWKTHHHGYARRLIADMVDMTKGKVNIKIQAGTVIAVNVDYMPNMKYKQNALYWFNAEVQPLRFEWQQLAASNLSDYVAQQTEGRIQNLVQSSDIEPSAPLFIASYMDLSVKWANRFDEDATVIGQFRTLNNQLQAVRMMRGNFYANISHNDELQAKILTLPLQGGNLSMTFILPDRKNGIKDLLPEIFKDVEVLWKPERNHFKHLPVRVTIPKMKLSSSLDGKRILQKMGISRLFTLDAELTKIAENEGIHLSQLKQKSVVELDEWGLNAAAGTKVEVDDVDEIRGEIEAKFDADHPFMFTITIRPRNDVLFFGFYGEVEVDDVDEIRGQIEARFTADHPFIFTITILPRNDVLFFGFYGGN